MSCNCKDQVRETLQRRIDEAKKIEFEQKKKLDKFQDGIRTGAQSLISRMVYRLGIYQNSFDNDCKYNPSHESVVLTLDKTIWQDTKISTFYSEHRPNILAQKDFFDIVAILRPITRKREKAPGLLKANIGREVEEIKKSLDRLEKLEKSLERWKEGTRREQKVEPIMITDLHQ